MPLDVLIGVLIGILIGLPLGVLVDRFILWPASIVIARRNRGGA